MNKQLALFVFLSSAVFAQSRFDGTWEMKMDTLQFSRAPEQYLIDHGMYRCLSCVPKVDVKADGTCVAKFDGNDYPIGKSGHANIALKVVDEYTLEETDKRDGKVMTVARMTVSKDGKSMTVESSDKQRGGTMIYTAEKRR